MNISKLIKDYGSRLALLAAAISLLLFVPACLTESTGLRVFLIIVIALLLIGGGVLLFLAAREQGMNAHYFLFDPKTRRSIPREELNAEIVQEKISRYLRPFDRSPLSLWQGMPRELQEKLEAEPQFKPLVVYQMLAALAGCPERHIHLLFSKADLQLFSYLCKAISEVGDTELGDYIYRMKADHALDAARIATFFKKNATRFSSRALHQVQKHFDQFYMEKSKLI